MPLVDLDMMTGNLDMPPRGSDPLHGPGAESGATMHGPAGRRPIAVPRVAAIIVLVAIHAPLFADGGSQRVDVHSIDGGSRSSMAIASGASPAGEDVFAQRALGSGCPLGCEACSVAPQPGHDPSPLACGAIPPVAGPIVRVAYLIPSNRTPQPDGVETLRDAVRWWHVWYERQMTRYGHGPRSFRYETEADGVTPVIHVVDVAATDDFLRADTWGHVLDAATSAGVPIWTNGQVWLLVPEMHLQLPDGSVAGGVALGASFGSGLDPGVAVIGSNSLAMMARARVIDNTSYAGQVVPGIGPFPLVDAVSFPWFEGSTFSSVASSALGAGVHELTHALGLGHNFRNDQNFHGNLMGNGLRGFRGSAYPASYATDDARLAFGEAAALKTSRYFLPAPMSFENVKPAVTVLAGRTIAPVNGLVEIPFTASDAGGLAAALLRLNGETVGELALSGTSTSATFKTAYYTAGASNQYQVSVYDIRGNRRDVDKAITPMSGFNKAPRAEFRVEPPTALPNQSVLLTAQLSNDPDHPVEVLTVEWDLDGDGIYDTAPTTSKTLVISPGDVGVHMIGLRVTDPAGAHGEASPIPLLVRIPGDLNGDGTVDGVDLGLLLAAWGGCAATPSTCVGDIAVDGADVSELGDDEVGGVDLGALLSGWP
ncbi:MAG: hypothetical protein U0575_00975 [Phycisphaerales bacterium]